MPIKYYGIYIAYPPTVNLKAEGLGRHLAAFLRAAVKRNDIRFVVACPSWSKKTLYELCESENVDITGFDIESPPGQPFILSIYETYKAYRTRPKLNGLLQRLFEKLHLLIEAHRKWLEMKVACSRSGLIFIPVALYLLAASIVLMPFGFLGGVILFFRQLSPYIKTSIKRSKKVAEFIKKIKILTEQPKDNRFATRLYRFMAERESILLVDRINSLKHVSAWYSPTAFWPAFNKINAPRLMCVPDVVLNDFPVGFANNGGDRILDDFKSVEQAILGGANFTTYSKQVKWETLVNRYFVPPDSIQVIPHAPNVLGSLLAVNGFPDVSAVSENYAHWLFAGALRNSLAQHYTASFLNKSVRFIFYASQFRPSKNIINLLRAYEYLLRKRYIGHKLILTGNPHVLPEVDDFIKAHNMENDVLCLHGLSALELAACYRLAELAVNPSLSEGGCPFTFTEALSVDTPAVMARLPVTLEVLDNEKLNDVMFFDPYEWKSIAERIEWAINNREELLRIQKPIFSQLAQRTWDDVVQEYLQILDRISSPNAITPNEAIR